MALNHKWLLNNSQTHLEQLHSQKEQVHQQQSKERDDISQGDGPCQYLWVIEKSLSDKKEKGPWWGNNIYLLLAELYTRIIILQLYIQFQEKNNIVSIKYIHIKDTCIVICTINELI